MLMELSIWENFSGEAGTALFIQHCLETRLQVVNSHTCIPCPETLVQGDIISIEAEGNIAMVLLFQRRLYEQPCSDCPCRV